MYYWSQCKILYQTLKRNRVYDFKFTVNSLLHNSYVSNNPRFKKNEPTIQSSEVLIIYTVNNHVPHKNNLTMSENIQNTQPKCVFWLISLPKKRSCEHSV